MKSFFKYYYFKTKQTIITAHDIRQAVDGFFFNCINGLKNKKIAVLIKVITSAGDWRNISQLQIIETSEKSFEMLKDIFVAFWQFRSDTYHTMPIEKIVLLYKFIDDNDLTEEKTSYPPNYHSTSLPFLGLSQLPNNTIIDKWSTNSEKISDSKIIINFDSHKFNIDIFHNKYKVDVIVHDKIIFSFTDHTTNDPLNFTRTINNIKYNFIQGKVVYTEKLLKTEFIIKKLPDKSFKSSFITMDLETRDINNIKQVYAACIYNGKTTRKFINNPDTPGKKKMIICEVDTFYLSDYKNSEDLIKSAINSLLVRKYNGHKVYLHNFSKFDGIFMLKILANMNNVKCHILKRSNNFINVKVRYNLKSNRSYSISFRDSLLMLPSKLSKLAENFNVKTKKQIFPYLFVNNSELDLNYKGEVPKYKHFVNITKDLYIQYINLHKNNTWSLKDATLDYCSNDVKSLWQILEKFQISIYKQFKVDINNYPTLSSLAFGIYRVQFMPKNNIPCLTGSIYKDIKQSYTGGSVDVYKPIGNNINRYDINSLYPWVMFKYPSPVGKIIQFTGNIFALNKDYFGFINVKVTTPDVNIPVLQTKVKTIYGGIRTIAPTGDWQGWYFSEEIKFAMKHGYKFEAISGYLFEKDYIFKDYVSYLYELKKKSKPDSVNYMISKLLLNSLYGRFGMSPDKETNVIIKGQKNIEKFILQKSTNEITTTDFIELGDDIQLVSYIEKDNQEQDDINTHENLSVSIASSITAYSRLTMNQFKIKYANNLYYSDTDSIDLDIKLPPNIISNKLGHFKLENVFNKVIYLAPKVYGAIINNKNQYIKVKGLKTRVDFSDLENLVIKNSKLEVSQEKWYRNIPQGHIATKRDKYTLIMTENKRKVMFKHNIMHNTIPYKLIDGKIIN